MKKILYITFQILGLFLIGLNAYTCRQDWLRLNALFEAVTADVTSESMLSYHEASFNVQYSLILLQFCLLLVLISAMQIFGAKLGRMCNIFPQLPVQEEQ